VHLIYIIHLLTPLSAAALSIAPITRCDDQTNSPLECSHNDAIPRWRNSLHLSSADMQV